MRTRSWPAAALFVALVAAPTVASAVTIEKVVAVVGEKAILLSDVRKRGRLALAQVYRQYADGPTRAAAVSNVNKVVLERMVEEQLEAAAAARQSVAIAADEIDGALRKLATRAGTTVSKFIEAAVRETGSTEQEFRQELRRQLLEGKLLARIADDRVQASEQELKSMFGRVVVAERGIRLYNPAWIVLRLPEDSPPEVQQTRRALADDLVARVRQGADFGALAQQYSDDDKTAQQGGNLGVRAPAGSESALTGKRPVMASRLEKVIVKLEPGEVSDVVAFEGALVIIKLVSRQPSRYTTWEAARDELVERLRAEQFQKAKEKWLKDLRRRTHVIVSL